jgi:hypothetical protein
MGVTIKFELKTKFKKILGKFTKRIILKRFKKTVNGEQELKKRFIKTVNGGRRTVDGERWTVNGER